MSEQLWRMVARGDSERLRAAAEVLENAEGLSLLSVSVFEAGPGHSVLEALFGAAPEQQALLRAAGMHPALLEALNVAPLPEEDWVGMSLAGLKPVEAGRFYLHGSHDAPDGAVPILIEANQAFGTGHHGTTKGCLLAFDALLSRGVEFTNVLDLGCGSGVLAIAAAKTTQARVTASDNDALAVGIAQENFAANSVPRIEGVVAEGLDQPALAARAPFDLIFANILAGTLIALAPAITAALAPGGRILLSGLLVEQRDGVLAAYRDAGLDPEAEVELDGWSTLIVRRP